MKNNNPKFLTVIMVILIASIFRIIPHWPNFTPLAAIALLSGAFISDKRIALLIPIAAMFISDIVTITLINPIWTSLADYFSSIGTLFIYLSYVLMTVIGFGLRKRQTAGPLALSALASSVLFFVMSNFGVWMINPLPKNLPGLAETYALGIPFFAYDLAGNLFYTFVSFAAIKVLVSRWPSLGVQSVKH